MPTHPPFSAEQARAARARVGLTLHQVTFHMAQLGIGREPDTVRDWESGAATPTEPELFALADALWCPVAVLMARNPRTLREYRLARQFTAPRLARRIGMDPDAYARAEGDHQWPGTDRQTLLLADALGLTPDELRTVLDRTADLTALLRQAVEGRWKQYAPALARLSGTAPDRTARALRTLHQEYARFNERYLGHLVARSDDARLREVAQARAAWLRALPDRFHHLASGG
ncbi:helix-turn-helix transcriptional regulator [Streptomyces sp. NRRL S-87]|uniref:helix-turn-helix transcriptional regulator n=1 Tax=Streptomyces sp. NRRL S-87 TaxID=1463920 RepID=UPI0004BED542|nr:helix-turn-helix transcriptional regulator [Streptomyces sp. NRRL S-87]